MSLTYEKLVTQRRHEMLKHPLFQEDIILEPKTEEDVMYNDRILRARVDYFRQLQKLPIASNINLA